MRFFKVWWLILLFGMVAACQWRMAQDNVDAVRSLDLFVPFQLEPFTNRVVEPIDGLDWDKGARFAYRRSHRHVLRPGDEILMVNGLEFRGMSTFLQELWKSQHTIPNDRYIPFALTVRSAQGRVHEVELGFPNCTCGAPTELFAQGIWGIPPCVVVGFMAVFLRRDSLLAWAWLLLMLSLAQVEIWPYPWVNGFQLKGTPMLWTGWPRIPAVGYRAFFEHSWPAAILLAAAHFCRTRPIVFRAVLTLAGSFAGFVLVEALLQIGWSENLRIFGSLYRIVDGVRTPLLAVSFFAVAAVTSLVNRRLALLVGLFAVLAAAALYRLPPEIPPGTWLNNSDGSHRLEVDRTVVDTGHWLEAMVFTIVCLATCLIAIRQRLQWPEMFAGLLALPLVISTATWLGESQSIPYFVEEWPVAVLCSSAAALLIASRSMLRRAHKPT